MEENLSKEDISKSRFPLSALGQRCGAVQWATFPCLAAAQSLDKGVGLLSRREAGRRCWRAGQQRLGSGSVADPVGSDLGHCAGKGGGHV